MYIKAKRYLFPNIRLAVKSLVIINWYKNFGKLFGSIQILNIHTLCDLAILVLHNSNMCTMGQVQQLSVLFDIVQTISNPCVCQKENRQINIFQNGILYSNEHSTMLLIQNVHGKKSKSIYCFITFYIKLKMVKWSIMERHVCRSKGGCLRRTQGFLWGTVIYY